MDKKALYDNLAERKSAPKDFNTYIGDNGRVNKCAELIRDNKLLVSGGKLLDVGGGIGDLGYAVRDLFDETWTLDISRKNLQAAESKGNKIVLADVDDVGLLVEDNSFTLVTALDFIEHIVDPENFAKECFRILKSGGEVFINTPNIQFFRHLESQLHGVFPHTSGDKEVYHGGHLAFFNFRDMEIIFGNAGFTNFMQVNDAEGFQQPPEFYINYLQPKTQQDYVNACLRLGCPNLLFKCRKP